MSNWHCGTQLPFEDTIAPITAISARSSNGGRRSGAGTSPLLSLAFLRRNLFLTSSVGVITGQPFLLLFWTELLQLGQMRVVGYPIGIHPRLGDHLCADGSSAVQDGCPIQQQAFDSAKSRLELPLVFLD